MAEQLAFDLPAQVSLAPGDFFVSAANAEAAAMIGAPGNWPQGKLALIGPKGAGKTHLARIAASALHPALTLAAAEIGAQVPGRLPLEALVIVEDMQTLPRAGEEALFHLHNHVLSSGGRLLLTAQTPPAQWTIALPDLASRMQATAVARIGAPDDALLAALLLKHFSDRQLRPAPAVLPYLVDRIERSYTAAAEVVARLDAAALAKGREITLPLARAVLDNLPI